MDIRGTRIRRILVVQFRPFGDVLLATTYLGALKRAIPGAEIDFLVFKPYDEVLEANPWVSRVITFRKIRDPSFLFHWSALLWRIRRTRYDLVIDQQSGTGSAEVVAASGACLKLGWRTARYHWLYNLKADPGVPCYQAVRHFAMLEPLGIAPEKPGMFYHVRRESLEYADHWIRRQGIEGRLVCVSPGTPVPNRKWNLERYGRLCNLIAANTRCVPVVLWAPSEESDARRVVAASGHTGVFLAPATTFNQAAAFVQRSALVITNNGGMNHLSVALGVRSLALFGNSPPGIWSAEGYIPGHYHLQNWALRHEPDNGFGITAEHAFDKVTAILREWRPDLLEQSHPARP